MKPSVSTNIVHCITTADHTALKDTAVMRGTYYFIGSISQSRFADAEELHADQTDRTSLF